MISIRDINGKYVEMRKNTTGSFFSHPIYFHPYCQLSSWQPKNQPTLLVSKEDWNYIKRKDVTHEGAFGNDYREWDKKTVNDRWISGNDIRGYVWVIVWKFPGDLNHLTDDYGNKVYKKIYNVPLPVGAYSFYDDKWTNIKVDTLKEFPKNITVEKIRIDFPSGNGIHFLENEYEIQVAMIGSHYFINEFWHVEKHEKENVVNMIKELYNINIYAFPCYTQHHAIVFYKTLDDNQLITPENLASLFVKNKYFVKILEKYSYYPLKSWVENYIKVVNSNLLESVKSFPNVPKKETHNHNYKSVLHKQSDPTGSLLRKNPKEERNWVSNTPVPNNVHVEVGKTVNGFTLISYNSLKGWVRNNYLHTVS